MIIINNFYQNVKNISDENSMLRIHTRPDRNDLSVGYAEKRYIKLNTKTQNIFCCVNENLMTFYTLWQGGQENRRRKKKFPFLKCIKSQMLL